MVHRRPANTTPTDAAVASARALSAPPPSAAAPSPSPTGTSAPVRIETGGPTSPRCRPGLEPELHPARVRWRHAVQGRPGRGRLTLVRRPEHIPVLGQASHTRSPSPAKPYATTRPTRSPGTHNPARVGVPPPSPRSRAPSAVLLLDGTVEDVEERRHLRPAQDPRPSRFKTLIEQLEQEDLIIRLQHGTATATRITCSSARFGVYGPTPIRWSTFRRTNGRSTRAPRPPSGMPRTPTSARLACRAACRSDPRRTSAHRRAHTRCRTAT